MWKCKNHKARAKEFGSEYQYGYKKTYIIHNGKMKYMSNRDKAIHFDNADMSGGGGCWSYECRKCGWVNDTFTE